MRLRLRYLIPLPCASIFAIGGGAGVAAAAVVIGAAGAVGEGGECLGFLALTAGFPYVIGNRGLATLATAAVVDVAVRGTVRGCQFSRSSRHYLKRVH